MEPVLFIAHHFPPMGGPGTHRSLQLVKRLPALGFRPIIITITEEDVRSGPYAVDESLLAQLPPEAIVVRVSTGEPRKFKKLMMKLRLYRFFWFFGYAWLYESSARWPKRLLPVARNLIKEHGIKLVYTSSGPYSSLFAGRALQKEGLRWVADLRDPYSDAYAWQWPSKLHWKISRSVEEKLLSFPDQLVVNTPETAALYHKRRFIDSNRITVLTNGY